MKASIARRQDRVGPQIGVRPPRVAMPAGAAAPPVLHRATVNRLEVGPGAPLAPYLRVDRWTAVDRHTQGGECRAGEDAMCRGRPRRRVGHATVMPAYEMAPGCCALVPAAAASQPCDPPSSRASAAR